MTSVGRPHYAIIAGFCASTASVFGKLISYSDEIVENAAATESQQVSIFI